MERSVVLHAVKGGLVSLASGENFISGALSAGITAGMGDILGTIENSFGQVVAAGIIGDVAATAGGGKFMIGFMTGAFTHALNSQKHESKRLTRWVKKWKNDGIVEKPISEWETITSFSIKKGIKVGKGEMELSVDVTSRMIPLL